MTSLFSQLEEISKLPHNWCSIQKATTLASIVMASRPALVVEIGTYCGGSALPLALACKHVRHGRVIGIDPYSPQASSDGQESINADWWKSVDHEMILKTMMERVEQYDLRPWLEIARVKSDDFVIHDNMRIGCLHVDGNHNNEQAARDVLKFGPYVVPGGFLVLDDIHWEGHISKSTAAAWNNGFRELFAVTNPSPSPEVPCDDWAVLQKI